MWAKKWLLGRDRFTHFNLLNFIRNYSSEDYRNYLRMSDENVRYLIAKVKPLIAKQDTVMRNTSVNYTELQTPILHPLQDLYISFRLPPHIP